MILGFPYQGSKTLLLLTTLILIVYQSINYDFFCIKSTVGGNEIQKVSSGLFRSKSTQQGSEVVVSNESQCSIATNEEQVEDCTKLMLLHLAHVVIITLLVLGLIPKYGEAAALGGGTFLLIASAYTFYEMSVKQKDLNDEIRSQVFPSSSSEAECIGSGEEKVCVKKSWGADFIINIVLLLLSLIILGLNGYGIFAQFMC